jgi:hypothetical protein
LKPLLLRWLALAALSAALVASLASCSDSPGREHEALAQTTDSARFEAESMTESSSTIALVNETAASGGKALKHTGGDFAQKTVTLSHDASTLELRARGTLVSGVWPTVRVFVDGTVYGTHNVATQNVNSATYQTYSFPVNVPAGQHTIHVKGLATDTTSKRPLYVDSLAFTGEEPPPPPPETTQAPPPVQGTLLWTGNAENPTNEDWGSVFTKSPYCGTTPQGGVSPANHAGYHERVTSNPTPMQGDYAYKLKVDDSYDCYQERTELSATDSSRQFVPGDENWEAFGVYLFADYDSAAPCNGARTSYQHKPIPSDNPTTSLVACGGNWTWKTQGGDPATPDKDQATLGPVVEGKWCRFLLHTKYSADASAGLTEVWSDVPGGCNGTLTPGGSLAKATLMDDTTAIRVNYGLYRDVSYPGTETMADDGYAVGTTSAVVTNHAFGSPFTPGS